MPQLFIPPEQIKDNQFRIIGSDAHHLLRVLRKEINDEVELTDGEGRRFRGKITNIDVDGPIAYGKILSSFEPRRKTQVLTLVQGLPKGSKFDYVLEKSTELGVDRIVPFLSQKTLIKLNSSQRESKRERWQQIVKAACTQCKRTTIPQVEAAKDLQDLAPVLADGFSILLWERETQVTLRDVLKNVSSRPKINIIVGPESGFTEDEVRWMVDRGAVTASLGDNILRTETVGLVALSVLNYELRFF